MNDETLRSGLAELIGTFILVFVGGFAVASAQGVVVAALAHGLILVGIIYMYGHISGAHVNPAVTAGLLVGGKIDITKAVLYWVAQFAGGIIAAVALPQFSAYRQRGYDARANSDLRNAATSEEAYYTTFQKYVTVSVTGPAARP